jgi:hypothetical protein
MKRNFSLYFCCFLLIFFYPFYELRKQPEAPFLKAGQPRNEALIKSMGNAGLVFTENKGQVIDFEGNVRPDVLFSAFQNGVNLFVTANSIQYQFRKNPPDESHKPAGMERKPFSESKKGKTNGEAEYHKISLVLEDGNPTPELVKADEGDYFENFYLSHLPEGLTGVRNFRKLIFKEVYPFIDWVIYAKTTGIEYDFIVHPGGRVGDIKLQWLGAFGITLQNDGGLAINSSLGTIHEKKPYCFDAAGKEVEGAFRLAENKISFEIQDYNRNATLIIDPQVIWATYYGGEDTDEGMDCATDKYGNVYLAGQTTGGYSIATENGHQHAYGGNTDAFLVKFDRTGERLWATYYGGEYGDLANACTTDGDGNVYLAGTTYSQSGISYKGHQQFIDDAPEGYPPGTFPSGDAFIVKFDQSGKRIWGSYYGGFDWETGNSCAVDAFGNVFLCGETTGSAIYREGGIYETSIAYNGFNNKPSFYYGFSDEPGDCYSFSVVDGFLVKFDSEGKRQWGTYYGVNGVFEWLPCPFEAIFTTQPTNCITDKDGNVYIAGTTDVQLKGIAGGGFKNTYSGGESDAFLAKFSPNGSKLWGTYYGGYAYDNVSGLAVDGDKNVVIAGNTTSTNEIFYGSGYQLNLSGKSEGYVAKFRSDGSIRWGTYVGGEENDGLGKIAIDDRDNIYLSGWSNSFNGINYGTYIKPFRGGYADAFIIKLNPTGSKDWGTYYGSTYTDKGTSCAVDNFGAVYLAGTTNSVEGIAYNGFKMENNRPSVDAFLVKLKEYGEIPKLILDCNPYDDKITSQVCGHPSIFGPNQWYVYAWKFWSGANTASNNIWKQNYAYAGYYIDTSLNFSTILRWDKEKSPSYAEGYCGCWVPPDFHSYSAKRMGFPPGEYILNVVAHDDDAQLLVNDEIVWERNGIGAAIETAWQGQLGLEDSVEFRVNESIGESIGILEFKLVGVPDMDNDGVPDNEDCAPDDPLAYRSEMLFIDLDNDNYDNGLIEVCYGPTIPESYKKSSLGRDCNDNNPAINPGATEVCNGIDDDCDGETDEGCSTGLISWYRDSDGDGFGDPRYPILSATKPAGYVANNLDCKDWDNTIYPGAPELEDGKDNDCDGEVDEGLNCRELWYLDGDGDGYGRSTNTNTMRWSCVRPNNRYVKTGGDCNDKDASIYPGAPELEDGKDNDCDGVVDDGLACLKPWYLDGDGDGYGRNSTTTIRWSCVRPNLSYVEVGGDCKDNDANVFPGRGCAPLVGIEVTNVIEPKAMVETAAGILVYPNPARDEIMVTLNGFEAGKKLEMNLVQVDGKVVSNQNLIPFTKSQQVRIDVRSMHTGYYMLQVKQGALQQTKKVMIVK